MPNIVPHTCPQVGDVPCLKAIEEAAISLQNCTAFPLVATSIV